MEEKKVLDLSEVLGERKSVVIRRGEVEYRLKDLDAFSTYQLLRIQKMRRKIAVLQTQDEISEEGAKEMEALLGEITAMLSDELPSDLTYTEKTTILAFYFMEVREKKARSPMK